MDSGLIIIKRVECGNNWDNSDDHNDNDNSNRDDVHKSKRAVLGDAYMSACPHSSAMPLSKMVSSSRLRHKHDVRW